MTPSEDQRLLVHAYVDGELDPANALEVERRIADDPALAAERDRVLALRALIRAKLPREVAPPGLRARIERATGLRQVADKPSWRALAASVLLTAVVASGGTFLATGQRSAAGLAEEEVVAGHLRGLMAAQPMDVASSDRHTVKPWFNGRTIASPRVVDLAPEGFPLAGGRLDVVGRNAVPTLVYHRAKHVISLTEITGAGPADAAPARLPQTDGYNMLRWSENGVTYFAVSDLAAPELERFATLFRTTPPEQ